MLDAIRAERFWILTHDDEADVLGGRGEPPGPVAHRPDRIPRFGVAAVSRVPDADPIPRDDRAGATGAVRVLDQRALPGAVALPRLPRRSTQLVRRDRDARGPRRARARRGRRVRRRARRAHAAHDAAGARGRGAARGDAADRGQPRGGVSSARSPRTSAAAPTPRSPRRERIADDDVARNRRIGAHGAALVPRDAQVLTHCNAGALACVGYGTALGVVRARGRERASASHVWVDETRPVLQGARLTHVELDRLGIDATLDRRRRGRVADGGAVRSTSSIVGADRIAANGDVANKIGTYALAVLARHHGIPFYVAAPTSTIDLATATGDGDRDRGTRPATRCARCGGARVAPAGVGGAQPGVRRDAGAPR